MTWPLVVLSLCLSVHLSVIKWYSSPEQVISQLRSVTCHMGSHSVTCHPTQVNTPRLNHSQTGQYLSRRDRRLSWPRWLGMYQDGLPVSRQSPIQIVTGPNVQQLHWSRSSSGIVRNLRQGVHKVVFSSLPFSPLPFLPSLSSLSLEVGTLNYSRN